VTRVVDGERVVHLLHLLGDASLARDTAAIHVDYQIIKRVFWAAVPHPISLNRFGPALAHPTLQHVKLWQAHENRSEFRMDIRHSNNMAAAPAHHGVTKATYVCPPVAAVDPEVAGERQTTSQE